MTSLVSGALAVSSAIGLVPTVILAVLLLFALAIGSVVVASVVVSLLVWVGAAFVDLGRVLIGLIRRGWRR